MLNGEWLAEVFRKFFGSEPGYTTVETDVGGSSTDGPFIRFAEAVFEEYGLPPRARSSIAKALTNAKRGYVRRKHAKRPSQSLPEDSSL